MYNPEIRSELRQHTMLKSEDEFKLYFDSYVIRLILVLNYSGLIHYITDI